MRMRFWLAISLGGNLALAGALLFGGRSGSAARRPTLENALAASPVPGAVRTNVIVRRQNFSWNEIESPDYPTYVANLRDIGCPESTIRDIIVADVNQLYAQRRAAEIVTPEQQWWRSAPDPDLVKAAALKTQALETERRNLLTRLLGPNWDAGTSPNTATVSATFNGPLLGNLTADQKQAIQSLNAQWLKRQEDYLAAQNVAGKPVDPVELARLQQQMRGDLAKVLSPEQMQEYLLRYSGTANRLRDGLQGIRVTTEDFRKLFTLQDPLDQQLLQLANKTDAESVKRRQTLEQQREAAIGQVLGTDQAALYRLNQDPTFGEVRSAVASIGAPPEAVLPIYQINRATDLERERIYNETDLSDAERSAALLAVEQEQERSLKKILGQERYARYQAQPTP
jgi:hypothetical protein